MKHNISKIIYPREYNGDYIVCLHPLFHDSFEKILEGSGRKFHVIKQFEQRLNFLKERKQKAVLNPKWIEKLGHYKDWHSIRIIDKDLNIRILFIFYTYQNREYAVLFSAFLEKKGKQARTDSYASEIELIQPILDRIKEVFHNGL